MSAVSHKELITPVFEAISTRSSQNLAADVFILIMVEPVKMECELFLSKNIDLSNDVLDRVKKGFPKAWQLRKNSPLEAICTADDDAICTSILRESHCAYAIRSPFELDEIGGGVLIWGWHEKPGDFSDVYIEKSKMITEQIKLTLKLALNEKQSQELSAKLAALLELSTAIYSSLNYTEVLEKAIHLSMKIIGASGGSIFILDKKENLIRPLITIDEEHEPEISQIVLRPGEGLTGLVVQTGMGLFSNQSDTDPRTYQIPGTPKEPESIICAPLSWSGEVIGTITLRSSQGKQFVQEDLEVLSIFARQTADAIENAKLFESLERAYKELSNTQEQLVMTEKLRALGEMAGGIAHDFNNVLGTILGRTQLMLREVKDSQWTEYLKQIEQVTLSGARTVQKLQNFTRISSRGQFEHVDLARIIADVIEATKPRWKDECQRQGINIDMQFIDGEIDSILGNKLELAEAISNVVLNAIDALPKGGYIKIRTLMEDTKAIVEVEDNGIGMSNATLNRIFYPFFTTKGIKNTGMGLAVVYGIVSRHNGEVDVTSKLGEGTVCTLWFPTAGKAIPKEEKAAQIQKEIEARILVIDDDENIRDVMIDMLEYMKHTVSQAASGEEGIEVFKKNEFDLVITDLGMPGISGWEVTKICKSLKPQIPVVMISGWGNQLDDELVRQSGLDAIMAKPFEINKIKIMIQEVLAKRPKASVDA